MLDKMEVIDICCGMGGLSLAAQNAGLKICAGIDISTHAIDTFKVNFPKAKAFLGDISSKDVINALVKITNLKKSNRTYIIVSGPPCQGFSDVGPRCPDDPRNNVLLSVAEVISMIKPKAAIIENVSALIKEKHLSIIKQFHSILNKSGYHAYCYSFNALDFGVPQNRNRVLYFILPFKIDKRKIRKEIQNYYIEPMKVKDVLGNLPIPPVRPQKYNPDNDNGLLTNHYAMQHSEKVKIKIASIEPGKGPLSYRKLDSESYASTLISGHRAPPVHYEQPRSITVREALRLQGFPDSFRVMGIFSRQMEQVTNAVPVPLGSAAIRTLNRLLEEYQ